MQVQRRHDTRAAKHGELIHLQAIRRTFHPKRWNSSPVYGIVTVWTIWLNVGEPGFTSITARASSSWPRAGLVGAGLVE
jgi:hypothetical protein